MAGPTDLTYQSSQYPLAPATSDDPDAIRRQIDYTRAQMTATINEIGERLSPDNLIEQAKSSVREATVGRIKDMSYQANRKMEDVSSNLGDTVRANPLPVALIGLGLGWLVLANRSKRQEYRLQGEYPYRTTGYRYYEGHDDPGMMQQTRQRLNEAGEAIQDTASEVQGRISQTAQRVGETVSDKAQRVGETVSDRAQRVGESVSDTAHRVGESVSETAHRVGESAGMVQERAAEFGTQALSEAERLANEARWRAQAGMTRTRESFWENMEHNPLAIGAVVLLAGAAIGAAIPSTEYENRLMGETRDRFMNEAKSRAQDTVERVQTVVGEAQQAAMAEVRAVAERENLPIGGSNSGTGNTGQF